MAGYTRVDTSNNISDGNVIAAADLDNEFDGIQAAFNASTGHNHDGTTGEGAPILVLGPTQDVVVGASTVTPKTTNTVDIGSSSLKFKDLYLAGNASIGGTLGVTGATTLSAALTYGGVTLSNAVTGTGNMVLSASPTLTGTLSGANASLSGTLAVTGVATLTAQPILSSLTASRAVFTDGSKGLVSNAITGTGNVVMSASPTLTGTISAEALTTSGAVTLSGGTANGVAYLNGSKVLTTGSALTFNGTNLFTTGNIYGGTGNANANILAYSNVANGGAGFSQFLFANTSSETRGFLSYSHAVDAMLFGVVGTERMRLDSSGNLGLGVTPSAWNSTYNGFDIGGSSISGRTSTNNQLDLASNGFRNAAGNWVYKYTGGAVRLTVDGSGSGFQWYTAPSGTAGNAISFTQAMTLDASGNLGVGVTNPSAYGARLVSKGTTSGIFTDDTNYTFAIKSGGSGVSLIGGEAGNALALQSGGTERARIDSSGNLLVGATSAFGFGVPSIQVGGDNADGLISVRRNTTSAADQVIFYNPNGLVGRIQTSAGSTSYITSSDYRLKNTIAPMTGALAKVAALKPCTYKWNFDGSDGQGFIAHELQEVCPDAVCGEKDAVDAEGNPQYQGIDTSFLVATLTAAIQEQQAIIESLKARLDAANL